MRPAVTRYEGYILTCSSRRLLINASLSLPPARHLLSGRRECCRARTSFPSVRPVPPDRRLFLSQVEDTLYRLHSFHLQRATTRFDAITKSLGDHAGVKEGGGDDHPLVLEGVQSLDFAHLLWFFYDSAYKWCVDLLCQAATVFTCGRSGIVDHALTPKWESVLLVAETFDMKQVAKVACFALGRAGALSDVRKIGLAAKHDLGKNWAVEELKRVIAREAPLTTEEGRELGTDLTIALAASRETQVRNQTLDVKPCAVTYCRTCCEDVLCQNRRHSCTFCRRSFPCPILRSVLDVTAIVDNITFPPLPRTSQHLLTWMKCLINVASGSTPGQMSCRWRTDIGQDLFVKVGAQFSFRDQSAELKA